MSKGTGIKEDSKVATLSSYAKISQAMLTPKLTQGDRVISVHRESHVLRALDTLSADVTQLKSKGDGTGAPAANEQEQDQVRRRLQQQCFSFSFIHVFSADI